ncbi:MAG: hypothetical protein ACYC27_08560 [Armatimonadota bacterium]
MTKKQAINVLHQIMKTANESSLTGALCGGGAMFADTFNAIREKAIAEKWIDLEIVPIINKNSGAVMDEVGCASAILLGLLLEE